MKTTLKSLFTISVVLLTFFFSGCEKELYDEPIYKNNNQVTEKKVTLAELIGVIKDPTIKNYLNNLTKDISSNLGSRLTDEELLYFQKFVKENEYTSYKLRLNEFTADKPYFLDFVIKTDDTTEKAGFIKYIPDEASAVFDARTFTGKIEVSNLNDHVVASNVVVNGVPTYSTNSFASIQCFSSMELVQHNCTHGGNHAPGEACDGPGGNDGYYELIITNFCLTYPEDLNFVAAPDISMGSNTGSGGPELSTVDIAFNTFINMLTPEQTDIFAATPGMIQFIKDNQVSSESQTFALYFINLILDNQISTSTANSLSNYLFANNYSSESRIATLEAIESLLNGVDDDKVCLSSFEFSDVGSNWQNAGVSNVNVQFLTIGNIISIQNVHFPELHFGLPKEQLDGTYITNYNARYLAQSVMTQAEALTSSYQSLNPTSSAIQLKSYFLSMLQDLISSHGGTVSTSAPLAWNGVLKEHETFIISSGIECD